MSHTLTGLEFLFTNGGIEVHTHAGPSVLASCVCTSRLNRGDSHPFTLYTVNYKKTTKYVTNLGRPASAGVRRDRRRLIRVSQRTTDTIR